MKFENVLMWMVFLSLYSCTYKSSGNSNKIIEPQNPYQFNDFTQNDFSELGGARVDAYTKQIIENFYKYFWEGNDLWGGFLVAQGNEIIYENYRGYSNLKDSTKINEHTAIQLASISKNLTAMVVLKLVEKGAIYITEPVYKVLPKFPYQDITIFDLLTHRSGLGNYDLYAEQFGYADNGKDFTNEEMYDMFAECKPSLLFKPNTQHSYCNTNYAFLALVIEKITGLSYPQAMKEILFTPLGMNDTYVFQKKDFPTATLSYYHSKKLWNWDFRDLIYGDKNIYSTPRDLFKYSEAMFSEGFLRKSLLDSAMTGYSYERKGIKNYGFGFRLREFPNGKTIIFHTGSWHGNNTLFVHLPEEKLTIISLGNRASKANYSAFSLPSLFGDYPIEVEGAQELDTLKPHSETDSATNDYQFKVELQKKLNEHKTTQLKKQDSISKNKSNKPAEEKAPDNEENPTNKVRKFGDGFNRKKDSVK